MTSGFALGCGNLWAAGNSQTRIVYKHERLKARTVDAHDDGARLPARPPPRRALARPVIHVSPDQWITPASARTSDAFNDFCHWLLGLLFGSDPDGRPLWEEP
jgi:hypothetical protein